MDCHLEGRKHGCAGFENISTYSAFVFRKAFMTTQRHIDAMRTVLRQIRARLALLESIAPPDLRDRELRRRIAEAQVEESVALAELTDLGVKP